MKIHLLSSATLFFYPIQSFQPQVHPKIITALSYYKPSLPLSSRLSEIKSEFSSIQSRGLDKFLLDEIKDAQKRLSKDVHTVEEKAEGIVKRGRAEEGSMMREAMKNSDELTALVNGLKGVRQEVEEVRGVKMLGDVMEETVKNDLLLERDLQSVTEKVASCLKEAETAIQSSLVTLSGEVSDDEKERVLKQLETITKSIQQSIQTSNTLATSAKKTAEDSISIIERISQTRNDLMNAMEDTEETIGFIAGNAGDSVMNVGKSLIEVAENVGNVAYEQTVKEVEAVEKLANVLSTKVGAEADAVLSINAKTSETILDTLQAAKNAIREYESASERTKLLNEYATKIKHEGDYMKQFSNAIQSDITRDKSSLEIVKNSNVKVQALIDAAENQVEMTKRAILTGDTVDPSYVEQNIADVKAAVVALGDATKASSEVAVQKLTSSNAKVMEKVATDEKAVTSTKEKVADDIGRDRTAKEDAEVIKSEPKDEPKAVEAKGDADAINSEQKVETKSVDAKQDSEASKSDHNSESNESETKGESVSSEEASTANDAKRTNEAPNESSNEVQKETTPIEQSSQSNDGGDQSLVPKLEKEHVADVVKTADDKVAAGGKETKPHTLPDTSDASPSLDSPAVSDIADSTTATTNPEPPTFETHQDLAADGHVAAESVHSLSAAPLDPGGLHTSSSELVHDLVNVASHAVEFVHDLANIVATSLFA